MSMVGVTTETAQGTWGEFLRNRNSGAVDTGSTFASPNTMITTGANYGNAAISSAQGGLDYILGAGAPVKADAAAMRKQAGLINGQANGINATAGQVKGLADKLAPVADQVGGMGDQLWAQGSALYDQANDVFGQGGALVTMDPSKGGLSAEYIKYWNSLSPDRYVSQATSDTQSAFQNAEEQAMRAQARQGVSAGSGNAAALRKQYAVAKATALAAAKTKARQVGLDTQAAELDKMVSAAKTMYDMGSENMSQALAAQNAGIGAKKSAGDIMGQAGSLYANAGQLQSTAGQLFGTAGNMFGNAGGLELDLSRQVMAGYNSVASAQQAAAAYYGKAAAEELHARAGGGGGGGQVIFPHYDISGNLIG